jgi:hypothetical protein
VVAAAPDLVAEWTLGRELREAFAFPRNVLVHCPDQFLGEWVAIPKADFDKARALLNRTTATEPK